MFRLLGGGRCLSAGLLLTLDSSRGFYIHSLRSLLHAELRLWLFLFQYILLFLLFFLFYLHSKGLFQYELVFFGRLFLWFRLLRIHFHKLVELCLPLSNLPNLNWGGEERLVLVVVGYVTILTSSRVTGITANASSHASRLVEPVVEWQLNVKVSSPRNSYSSSLPA